MSSVASSSCQQSRIVVAMRRPTPGRAGMQAGTGMLAWASTCTTLLMRSRTGWRFRLDGSFGASSTSVHQRTSPSSPQCAPQASCPRFPCPCREGADIARRRSRHDQIEPVPESADFRRTVADASADAVVFKVGELDLSIAVDVAGVAGNLAHAVHARRGREQLPDSELFVVLREERHEVRPGGPGRWSRTLLSRKASPCPAMKEARVALASAARRRAFPACSSAPVPAGFLSGSADHAFPPRRPGVAPERGAGDRNRATGTCRMRKAFNSLRLKNCA